MATSQEMRKGWARRGETRRVPHKPKVAHVGRNPLKSEDREKRKKAKRAGSETKKGSNPGQTEVPGCEGRKVQCQAGGGGGRASRGK